VKSKLYPAMVLAGISWGSAAAGCGDSRRHSDGAPRDPEGPETSGRGPSGGSAGAGGATGAAGSSGGTSSGGAQVTGGGSGGTAGVAGSGGDGAGGASGGAGAGGASGGDGLAGGEGGSDPVSGSGGSAAGVSGAGGLTDAGTDGPDPFCDTTWPTTKGNPAAPPTCADQAACGGPVNDAGFPRWLQCRVRLGDFQCEYFHVTSYCKDGEWACPPDGIPPGDCRCFGPTPAGMICTEDGFVPIDGGAAGAPG
jgi:hypothetical protein